MYYYVFFCPAVIEQFNYMLFVYNYTYFRYINLFNLISQLAAVRSKTHLVSLSICK